MRTRTIQQPAPVRAGAALAGCLLKLVGAGLIGAIAVGFFGYMTFYAESHHQSPSSMFFLYGDMTPPKATDITLRANGLYHTAEFTVAREDLDRFLRSTFEADEVEEPEALTRERYERSYRDGGLVDWEWHEGIVEIEVYRNRGTTISFLHDPRTGRTYEAADNGW
ncbi:MAG: hypothetical protein PVJ89_02265 [Planctomycetota bacterium]|jgi:hypothetical protein